MNVYEGDDIDEKYEKTSKILNINDFSLGTFYVLFYMSFLKIFPCTNTIIKFHYF